MVARVTSSSLKSLLVLMGVCALGCTGNSEPGSAGQGGTANAGGSSGGTVAASGSANDSSAPDDASTGITVTPVAAAVRHACAIRNGAVYCWGDNLSGQLGDGTTTQSSVAVQVQELTSGAQAVAVGSHISCAFADANVWCWGDWFGVDTQSGSPTPVPVQGLGADVQSIVASVNACWAW